MEMGKFCIVQGTEARVDITRTLRNLIIGNGIWMLDQLVQMNNNGKRLLTALYKSESSQGDMREKMSRKCTYFYHNIMATVECFTETKSFYSCRFSLWQAEDVWRYNCSYTVG